MFKISLLTLTLQRCGNFYKAQMNTYYDISKLYNIRPIRLVKANHHLLVCTYHIPTQKTGRKHGSISGEFNDRLYKFSFIYVKN